jgi:G:T-mismatch repair DNA endonuclease (very short patch repair protein)
MEENLILDYFDVKYDRHENHSIKLKLKDIFKSNKSIPRRKNNMPYSGVEKEYYIHYLGEELGIKVFFERKKLCSRNKLFEWYIATFNPPNADELLREIENTSIKIKDSLKAHYESPAAELTKLKYKARAEKWAGYIGNINSKKWLDKDWKEAEMSRRNKLGMYEQNAIRTKIRMQDENFRKKFHEACNTSERKSKISKSSKKMWREAKINDPEKVKRMIYSSTRKSFNFNGIKMNSIEFIIASLLESLDVQFEYETIHNLGDVTYIPDFYIKEHNLVIECFGDYWHANPLIYETSDVIFRHSVYDIRERDRKKSELFISNGYQYIVFWEHDIRNNLETIKNELCNILKKN